MTCTRCIQKTEDLMRTKQLLASKDRLNIIMQERAEERWDRARIAFIAGLLIGVFMMAIIEMGGTW